MQCSGLKTTLTDNTYCIKFDLSSAITCKIKLELKDIVALFCIVKNAVK